MSMTASRRALPGSVRPHLPTPSSSSCIHLPIQSTSFSTSAPLSESKAKRRSRLVRKTHLEKKAALTRSHALEQPDPVLGYAKGKENVWETSLLKSVLLDRKDVWGEVVKVLPDDTEGVAGAVGATPPTPDAAQLDGGAQTPKHYNFGLTSADVEHLSTDLPLVAAHSIFANASRSTFQQLAQEKFGAALQSEAEKRDKLMRIVDLKNAGSKGIEVENTRRIVQAFGRQHGDTGLPEVQAAILTARIHSLHSHLVAQPRDIHNRRPLQSMVQQRVKTLKYLRSLDVQRYEDCLEKIGVEARAVEGEVVVTKAGLKALIRPA